MAAMRADELDYELPAELIAQHPSPQRDESRLLVYSRTTGEVSHAVFRDTSRISSRRERSPS